MKNDYSVSRRRLLWLSVICLAGPLVIIPANGQSIVKSWQGISGPTGSVPPDPHGAPGPAGVIAVVNLQIAYYDKSGGLVWGATNFQNFWASVGNSGNGLADPRAIFDQESRRFFVILQENTASRCWLNVAVSRNADPRTAGATDWRFYRLDATEYTATNTAGGVHSLSGTIGQPDVGAQGYV